MALDLRHVDHPRFHTFGTTCCFQPTVVQKGDKRVLTRFQLKVCGASMSLVKCLTPDMM